jgi:wyosine [tRNA(Phe)-imidazoG37] synthetase (radical SAM superfamily)
MANYKNTVLKHALRLNPDRKLFCPIPFKYLEIMGGGNAILCCYINKSAGMVKDNNLQVVYNSPAAQEIRASILDGTFSYCNLKACPHFSAGDLPLQKDCVGSAFEDIIANKLTVLEKKSIWITFDERCNLRCISCRKDFVKYSKDDHENVERLLDAVRANLTQLEQIGLCGSGDPFASPSLRKFLYDLDASQYPNLKVTILTNGQLFNEQAWDNMKKGRSAIKSVQVSVDAATKETYENVRIGGSFDKLRSNLDFISQLRRNNLIGEFIISFVVNAINFNEMDKFVNLGKSLGCDQVYFSYMVDWGSLSKERYEELAIHLPSHVEHQDFLRKLEDPIFGDSIVQLGNIKKFRQKGIMRDSLFS